MKWLFLGIMLKITSSLCKMKSTVTIRVKNAAHYTHLLYILLTMMEIFNTILFVSFLMITTLIQVLFIKYKQSLLITLKKTFKLWIRSSISLTAVLKNIRIAKTLFISLCHHQQDFNMDVEWIFFATSHGKSPCDHTMMLGDLLNIMLQNIVHKDPYMTRFWATNQCLIYV